jgi:hypothetical protein
MSPPLPGMQASLCLRLRCLLLQGQAKIKWSLPPQACCSLNEDTVDFFISYVSWVLANIMTDSSCCFWKLDRNSGCRFCRMVCLKSWADFYTLIYTPLSGAEEAQWVVRPAHHCFLWWRWWSDTLWVTLVRLWLHLLSCNLWTIVVEISLQFYRHMQVSAFIKFHIWCWESTCFFSFNVVIILQSSLVGVQAKQNPISFTKPAVVMVLANAWLGAPISMEVDVLYGRMGVLWMQVFWKKEEMEMVRYSSVHRETLQRKAVIGAEFASVLPVRNSLT